MKFKGKTIFFALVAAIFAYIVWDSMSQPGKENLSGDFKELAFYRNEQNTGPIMRVYAATVGDTLWNQMEEYGNYMPHNKYGNTKVYFFLNDGSVPENISLEEGNLEPEFYPYCIASYEKASMGQVMLVKFPFRNQPVK